MSQFRKVLTLFSEFQYESCFSLCDLISLHVWLFMPDHLVEFYPTAQWWWWEWGGYSIKFYMRRYQPEVQPVTILYTILEEKVSLLYR